MERFAINLNFVAFGNLPVASIASLAAEADVSELTLWRLLSLVIAHPRMPNVAHAFSSEANQGHIVAAVFRSKRMIA
ncbi:hypothetical protein C1J03_06005 [Sulfitobacter sp. SK012]|nr:hypothetical protein C1J03_06005 [Sulfitobacter sp. SK012]